jgi:hypothetical protein
MTAAVCLDEEIEQTAPRDGPAAAVEVHPGIDLDLAAGQLLTRAPVDAGELGTGNRLRRPGM